MNERIALTVINDGARGVIRGLPKRQTIGAIAMQLPVDRTNRIALCAIHFRLDRTHIRARIRLGGLDRPAGHFDRRSDLLFRYDRRGVALIACRGEGAAIRHTATSGRITAVVQRVGIRLTVDGFLIFLQPIIEDRLLVQLLVDPRQIERLQHGG